MNVSLLCYQQDKNLKFKHEPPHQLWVELLFATELTTSNSNCY